MDKGLPQGDRLQQPLAYGLLENWPLWNTAGDSKLPGQEEQRQGDGRDHPNKGGEEEKAREPGLNNNTGPPSQVATEDRRGRSGAVVSENLTDPSPGEMHEEAFHRNRKKPAVESTKSSQFKHEQNNDHRSNDSSTGSHA